MVVAYTWRPDHQDLSCKMFLSSENHLFHDIVSNKNNVLLFTKASFFADVFYRIYSLLLPNDV